MVLKRGTDDNLSDGNVENLARFQQLHIRLLLATLRLVPGRVVRRRDFLLGVEKFVLFRHQFLGGRQTRIPVPDAAVQHLNTNGESITCFLSQVSTMSKWK